MLKSPTIVGRSALSDLILDNKNKEDQNASSRHAELKYLEHLGWELTDLKSTNGVLLQRSGGKEKRVFKVTLEHGDVITFGGAGNLPDGGSPAEGAKKSVYQFRFECLMLAPQITEKSKHEKRKIDAFLEQQNTVKAVLRKENADLKSALEKITHKCASDLVRGLQGQAEALSMANILLRNENGSHVQTIKNQAMEITKHESEISNLKSTINELQKRKKLDLHEVLAQIFQDDGEELRGLMQCVETRVSNKYQEKLDKANLDNEASEVQIRRLEEDLRRLEEEQRCAKKQKCDTTGAAASPNLEDKSLIAADDTDNRGTENSQQARESFQPGYPPSWHQSSTGTDGNSLDFD